MKTLVVDDDLASRLVLENAVSQFGPVDSCANGAEAVRAGIQALRDGEPYDLICMDIMMPAMSGLEALDRIRAEERRLGREHSAKVVMITSSDDGGYVGQAFGSYCDAYIVKPVDTAAFLGIVECLCPVDL